MNNLPPLSAFSASVIGLVACLAIYLGGQGNSRLHRLSIASGVVVVLCISILPYYLLKAFDNLGNSSYESAFIAYLAVSAASSITALAISAYLLLSRRSTAA